MATYGRVSVSGRLHHSKPETINFELKIHTGSGEKILWERCGEAERLSHLYSCNIAEVERRGR